MSAHADARMSLYMPVSACLHVLGRGCLPVPTQADDSQRCPVAGLGVQRGAWSGPTVPCRCVHSDPALPVLGSESRDSIKVVPASASPLGRPDESALGTNESNGHLGAGGAPLPSPQGCRVQLGGWVGGSPESSLRLWGGF